jgi:hypothetical protein
MKTAMAMALMFLASVAFSQTLPKCDPTKTPTPKVKKTPTPTATPTMTRTPAQTPTPTPTPTDPGPTPTPLPRCSEMGGTCGPFYGCTGNSAFMSHALDCDYCCKPVTPTPTPTPLECGSVCVPSFIQAGAYFIIPEITDCSSAATVQPVWRVERILFSGWILLRNEDGGRETWVQFALLKQMVPVWAVGIQ